MIRQLIFTAIALAAVSGSAQAQNSGNVYRPTGTRIISQGETVDPDFARRLLKLTAACVNRYDAEGVVALLRGGNQVAVDYADAGVRDEADLSPLRLSECLHEALNGSQVVVEMRIPPRALRTVLAEEAYLQRHADPLDIAPGSPQVLAGRTVIGGQTPAQSQAMGTFADCLVYHAPTEADRLLRGPVGGDIESERVRALVPTIARCLNEGQEANFTNGAIRDFVADGLWARSEYGAAQVSGNSE